MKKKLFNIFVSTNAINFIENKAEFYNKVLKKSKNYHATTLHYGFLNKFCWRRFWLQFNTENLIWRPLLKVEVKFEKTKYHFNSNLSGVSYFIRVTTFFCQFLFCRNLSLKCQNLLNTVPGAKTFFQDFNNKLR